MRLAAICGWFSDRCFGLPLSVAAMLTEGGRKSGKKVEERKRGRTEEPGSKGKEDRGKEEGRQKKDERRKREDETRKKMEARKQKGGKKKERKQER